MTCEVLNCEVMCRRWDALLTVAADDLRLEREHAPALESLSAVDCRKEA